MKRKILCLLLAVSGSVCGFAQQTDPALTGAVAAQTKILKDLFKKREKTQQAIIASEASVFFGHGADALLGEQDAGLFAERAGCHAEHL